MILKMLFENVNFVAILIAVVASMVVGAMWYSMMGFGKPWMRLVGKSESDLKKGGFLPYVIAVAAGFILACVLSVIINLSGASSVMDGAMVGFWAWLGFVATTTGINSAFSGRPRNLYLIEIGHHLMVMLLMGAILASWG